MGHFWKGCWGKHPANGLTENNKKKIKKLQNLIT